MIGSIAANSLGARLGAPTVEALDTSSVVGGDQVDGAQGFAAVFDQIASGVAQSLRTSEQVATQGVLGTQSVQATVESVMAAEQSLQVGIGIRDRIVNAYLELSRMAI